MMANKKSSTRLSKLAARYLKVTVEDLSEMDRDELTKLAKDVRSLAASVLSQDEVKGEAADIGSTNTFEGT